MPVEILNAQVRIHMDYCADNLCKYCAYKDCKVRKEVKSISLEWTQAKMLGDPIELKGHIS
ncbi:MAG: hypothetical protein IIA48_04640 [Bacteroidetes bacterium]|nr:hypothetical protein [Bacteroidota bacterium]